MIQTRVNSGETNFYIYVNNDPLNFIDVNGLCRKPYFERAWAQFKRANKSTLGKVVKFGLGTWAARTTTTVFDGITLWNWARSGFAGARFGASAFTALETGVIATGTTLVNTAIVTASYEVGLGLGSLLSAYIFPDWPPCDNSNDGKVNPCK